MSEEIRVAFICSKITEELPGETPTEVKNFLNKNENYKNVKVEFVFWNEPPGDWTKFTHIIFSSYLVYIDVKEEFLSWLDNLPPEVSKKLINPRDVIHWNISKEYLSCLEKKGIRIAPTVWITKENKVSNEIVRELTTKNQGVPKYVVAKNIIDADGTTTRKIQIKNGGFDPTDEQSLQKQLDESENGIMIQVYLSSVKTEGEWSLIYFDKKFSHCVIKNCSGDEFRIQTTYGGKYEAVENELIPNDVKTFGDAVISALDFDNLLYARVDLLRNERGEPCLMEMELFEPFLYFTKEEYIQKFVDLLPKYKF